ncbi:MAG: PAS domain S-box protein [Syntrophobacteraceae bacterium]
MNLWSWKIGRTLTSRVTMHLLLTILVLGICLYYFNLRLLSDFAERQIDQSLSASSQEIRDICDTNLERLFTRGLKGDEEAVSAQKAKTIADIKKFMCKNGLWGQIVSGDGKNIFSSKCPIKPHRPRLRPKVNAVGSLRQTGKSDYYETSVLFRPWSWKITIDEDASQFTHLKSTVRNAYLFTELFLFFSAALLLYFFNQAVKMPVRKIIDDIRAGKKPSYEGIEEFAFLSANIAQMMRKLQVSEQTIRDIATGMGEGVYVVDKAGEVVFMNQQAERLLGWNQAQMLGRSAHDVFHRHISLPGDTADFCPVLNVVDTGETCRIEEDTFLRKDGSLLPVAYVAAPLNKNGSVGGAITVFRDITERKRIENRQKEQLDFFQQLLDSIPVPVSYKDSNGLYLGCNAAFETFLGVKRDDLVNKTLPDLTPEGIADVHQQADLELICRPGIKTYEFGNVFHDGNYHDVVMNKATFLDAGGNVAGIVSALVDITDRKQAEQERLCNLKFFESMDLVNRAIQGADSPEKMMKDLLDVVLAIFDCDRAFLKYPCDPEAKTWTIPMESCKPQYPGVWELHRPMDMDRAISQTDWILLTSDGPVIFGPGSPHKPGSAILERFFVKSYMSMAIYPKTGSPWEFGVQQCDCARQWTKEEKRLLEAIGRRLADGLSILLSYRDLRENEEFLDKIVEHIPNLIYVKDAKTLEYVRFNSAGEHYLGYSRQELLGKTASDFFPAAMADSFEAQDRQVIESGKILDIPEEVFFNKNNEKKFMHTQKMALLDDTGTVQYVLGISEDISERRQAEESIRKLSQAIEQSPVSIVITNVEGKIEFVNAKFTQITGYSFAEAMGMSTRILKSGETPPETYKELWRTISSGAVWQGEFHNRKKSGELFWEKATIAPVRNGEDLITHYVAVKEDITERKKLEEQLRQAQKLEAVGRLAGGVAHDFNNMLSVILGYSELILSRLKPLDPMITPLKAVQSAAKRSADLTRQLLAFSRKQTIAPRVIDLNEQTKNMERLLTRIIGEDIELVLGLCEELWPVYMDPAQVDQVLANLAVNSRDAMPQGGKLTVETFNVTLDSDFGQRHPDFTPGDFVLIAVTDTGCGIDRQTLEHVFEPFFTTKPEGKGTGLGLATVYGIVKQNGGLVNIYSEPGLGTTAKLYLPRHTGIKQAATEPVLEPRSQGGKETVLLVEDEGQIREMAKTMLEELGYIVIEAHEPSQAIALFENHSSRIDLLFTDVVMPNMNGKELAKRIRELKPGIRTLFMSGYTADAIAHLEELDERAVFLQKPFSLNDLAAKIRQALSA